MNLGDFAVDGLVSAAQARALGVEWNTLRRCVASGTLHRVIPGWYAVSPPASPAARHVLEARAWVRHFQGHALASHHSAVLLHGLPTLGVDLAQVHLTRAADRHTRARAGLSVHPALVVPTVTDRECGRARSVAVHVALSVVQTGMVNGSLNTLVSGDAALRTRATTMADIEAAVHVLRRMPGLAAVRLVVGQLDGRHESVGETRLAHMFRGLGIAATPQVWVRGLRDWGVDFLVDGTRVVVEFDGAVKYTGPGGRDALLAEKRREDALRELGFEVVRVTWADLVQPQVIRARVRAAVARAVRHTA